jgi:hypothetical protein
MPASQRTPQPPQFCGSFFTLVQCAPVPVPQAFGAAAGHAQTPAVHPWPRGHAFPQPPQFAGSICVLTQLDPQSA